jgi:hypothetical protein
VIDDLHGPDIQDPNHTYLPDARRCLYGPARYEKDFGDWTGRLTLRASDDAFRIVAQPNDVAFECVS